MFNHFCSILLLAAQSLSRRKCRQWLETSHNLRNPAKQVTFFGGVCLIYLIFLKVFRTTPTCAPVDRLNVSFHIFPTGHASPLRHGRPTIRSKKGRKPGRSGTKPEPLSGQNVSKYTCSMCFNSCRSRGKGNRNIHRYIDTYMHPCIHAMHTCICANITCIHYMHTCIDYIHTLHAYMHRCIDAYITCIHAYMHTCHAYMHTCHAYMHPCIHASMHTCICAYMHMCIRYMHTLHAYMHRCIHYIHTSHAYITCIHDMHTCIHYMHTCIHAHMHTCHIMPCIHAYMPCIHAYMHAYVHTYIRKYVHTYIRTYIQDHTGICIHIQGLGWSIAHHGQPALPSCIKYQLYNVIVIL